METKFEVEIKDGWIEPRELNFTKKFKKKPVIIEAMQLPIHFRVTTLEGVMEGKKGDWLIRGVNGELYPCKPDIFDKTYEKVKDEKP